MTELKSLILSNSETYAFLPLSKLTLNGIFDNAFITIFGIFCTIFVFTTFFYDFQEKRFNFKQVIKKSPIVSPLVLILVICLIILDILTCYKGSIVDRTLHKTIFLTSDYYHSLSVSEQNYVKSELLDSKLDCLDNMKCQNEFNYHIKLGKIDHIISEIKKQRELEIAKEVNQTKDTQLNQEFWQLIQK